MMAEIGGRFEQWSKLASGNFWLAFLRINNLHFTENILKKHLYCRSSRNGKQEFCYATSTYNTNIQYVPK